jgi:hypothetical protein
MKLKGHFTWLPVCTGSALVSEDHVMWSLQEPPPVPQSPPPVSEDEVQRSTDEDLSGDLLQVGDVKTNVLLKILARCLS